MDKFIEISFSLFELSKVDKVMYHLTSEGWSVMGTETQKRNGGFTKVVYKLYRHF